MRNFEDLQIAVAGTDYGSEDLSRLSLKSSTKAVAILRK